MHQLIENETARRSWDSRAADILGNWRHNCLTLPLSCSHRPSHLGGFAPLMATSSGLREIKRGAWQYRTGDRFSSELHRHTIDYLCQPAANLFRYGLFYHISDHSEQRSDS